MARDVYVQYYEGVPATRNLYDCFVGFKSRGHRIIPFESFKGGPEEVPNLRSITRKDILCAGIPVFRKVCEYLQVPYTPLGTYPSEVQPFLGRTVTKTTMGSVRDTYTTETKPFFLKPDNQKVFTGLVVTTAMDLLRAVHVEDNEPVWVSGVVDFVSEYRVYVNKTNKYSPDGIQGVGHYNGNPLVFPDPKTIRKIVNTYNKVSPVAYALDVGVASRKGETLVVEVNDATSLGNYGIPSPVYAQMLECRWDEILQSVV